MVLDPLENNSIYNIPHNKNINKLINSKNKARKTLKLDSHKRFCFQLSCINYSKGPNNNSDPIMRNLSIKADKIIEAKSDILKIWNNFDQFNLFKKIFLNANQCYMLKNIGLKTIINNSYEDLNEEKPDNDLEENRKEEDKRISLGEYLRKRRSLIVLEDSVNNEVGEDSEKSNIDSLLWSSMEKEVKQIVQRDWKIKSDIIYN